MHYTQVVVSTKERISEIYPVDGVSYAAELEIHSIGCIGGMAGLDEHVLTLSLAQDETRIGSLRLEFPTVRRTEGGQVERMLIAQQGTAKERRFTPWAEQRIREAVVQYVRMRTSCHAWKSELSAVTMRL